MQNYNNMYPYQMYQQPYQQVQQPVQQTMQIQNGGFISVRNIEEARNYPVAPGNSVTFKDEQAPYVYTKTQGFSQLDRPIFEKYRLIKEEEMQQEPVQQTKPEYALKSDLDDVIAEIRAIKEKLEEEVNE